MIKAGVDYVVLGCSHYPYLMPTIKGMIPEHIKVIDSGFAVARQTETVLHERGLLRERPIPIGGHPRTTKSQPEAIHKKYSDDLRLSEITHGDAALNDSIQHNNVSLEFWTNGDTGPLKQLLGTDENDVQGDVPPHFEPSHPAETNIGDQNSGQNPKDQEVQQSSQRKVLRILKKDF